MHAPLARPDYYEASAPPGGHQLATSLPIHRPGRAAGGRPRMVPTFTQHRSTRSAASSTPAASPCLRRSLSAWPPHRRIHSASELTHMAKQAHRSRAASRPISTRFEPALSYGASATGSLTFRLLILLAGPGPSGDTEPSWRCSEPLLPSPAFPGSGCPQLHRAAATTRRRSPSISARIHSASWRTQQDVPHFPGRARCAGTAAAALSCRGRPGARFLRSACSGQQAGRPPRSRP